MIILDEQSKLVDGMMDAEIQWTNLVETICLIDSVSDYLGCRPIKESLWKPAEDGNVTGLDIAPLLTTLYDMRTGRRRSACFRHLAEELPFLFQWHLILRNLLLPGRVYLHQVHKVLDIVVDRCFWPSFFILIFFETTSLRDHEVSSSRNRFAEERRGRK